MAGSGLSRFETEHYFARFEFTAPHLLAPSDCESISVADLLEMAGGSLQELGQVALGYTEPQGSIQLRTAIAASYQRVEPDAVIVLNAPIEGIYLTMRTLLAPGDDVVVLMPTYDALKNLPADVGAVVKPWFLVEERGRWSLDLDALAALLTERTRLVVASFPHNPTGYLPDAAEFATLIELVDASGAWLYHDEIFRGLEHGTRPQLPSAAETYERAVVLGGLSKAHGLPGLRAGWLVIGDSDARAAVINTKMYTSICPPAPVEYIATKALAVGEQLVARNRQLVSANLDVADTFFATHSPFFTYSRPLAGPVAMVGIAVPSAEAYCLELAEKTGIMLLPSKYLGLGDSHVRFGFGRKSFASSLAKYDAHIASGMAP